MGSMRSWGEKRYLLLQFGVVLSLVLCCAAAPEVRLPSAKIPTPQVVIDEGLRFATNVRLDPFNPRLMVTNAVPVNTFEDNRVYTFIYEIDLPSGAPRLVFQLRGHGACVDVL